MCNTESANLKSVLTSRRWLNRLLFVSELRDGVEARSTSNGNLNYRPIAARLRGKSVSSMGAPFHAY